MKESLGRQIFKHVNEQSNYSGGGRLPCRPISYAFEVKKLKNEKQ